MEKRMANESGNTRASLDLTPSPLPANVRISGLRYTSPIQLFARIDVCGYVEAPARFLLVVGDGDNGAYEWALCDDAGNVSRHSDDGFGGALPALRDGLNAVMS